MNHSLVWQPTEVLRKLPHPGLEPFVCHYVFRNIRFPEGCCVQKAMPLRVLSTIDFFMGDRFESIDYNTGQADSFERCTVRGPRTRKLCFIRLRGHFISFSIKLKPGGLYHLTGVPTQAFTDKSIPGDMVRQLPLKAMAEKLLSVHDVSDCIRIAESYFLLLAKKKGRFNPWITENVTMQLARQNASFSIARLAEKNHLSLRQMERIFTKEVGVSPKTLYRMHRFRRLIQARINEPFTKWAVIANEFGYYDQMHLIRDFRQFLGINPSDFAPADFAF